MRRITPLVVFGFAALWAVAPAAAAAPTSGVRGFITTSGCAGPVTPDGGNCHSDPLRATVRVLRRCDGSEVTRFRSRKADGRYRVELPEGRYLLDPLESSGGLYKGRIRVRVRAGHFVRRDIDYDNGQR